MKKIFDGFAPPPPPPKKFQTGFTHSLLFSQKHKNENKMIPCFHGGKLLFRVSKLAALRTRPLRILRQVASTNSILTALPNARATRPTVESRTSSV